MAGRPVGALNKNSAHVITNALLCRINKLSQVTCTRSVPIADRYMALGQLTELVQEADELFCKLHYDEIPENVQEKSYEELIAHLRQRNKARAVKVAKAGSR